VIQGSHPTDATCRAFVDDLVARYDRPTPSKRIGRTDDAH